MLSEILKEMSEKFGSDEIEKYSKAINEAFEKEVGKEKEKGISSYQKKDKEVVKLKGMLKELGYDKDTYDSIDEFKSSIQKAKDKADNSDMTISSLNSKIETLTEQFNKAEEQKTKLAEKNKKSTIYNKLNKSIGDQLYGSEYVIESLINNKKVDMNGENVVFRNGDDVVDFDTGVKKLLDENKDILKVNQKSGNNSKNQKSVINDLSDFDDMSVDDALANIDQIKETINNEKSQEV